MGEALKRSASSLAVAGNDINEAIGLITGANTVVQQPEVVGTALKTMSLRLTTTKAKLEEMGEETEYACETLSEYRNLVLALTANTKSPVDIIGSDGNYKSTVQTLRELSAVWHELNSMEQSAIMKALFGVRQANIGASLLENFDIVESAIKSAQTASEGIGSAMQEQERWADSLEARINQVNSSLQVLSTDIFSTDGIKEFVSSVNDLVQAIDWVVKKIDVVKIAFSAFSAWMLNTKNIISATVTETGSKINLFGHQWSIFTNSATQANQAMELQVSTASSITKSLQMYNSTLGQSSRLNTQLATTIPTTTMQQYLVSLNGAEASMQGYVTWLAQSSVVTENANMVITRYKSITSLGADAQAIFRSEVAKTNPAMAQYLATTNAASMSQKNYQSYLRKTELQTKATTLATQALNVAMSLGVTAIITGVVQWIGNLADKYNDLLQESSKLRTELETQVGTLTNLRKQYEELMTSTVDEKTRNERLTEIKKTLVERYGFEEEKIRTINQLRAEGLGLIDEEIAKQRQETIGKTEDVFNKALGQVSQARTSYSIVDTFGELGVKVKNLKPEIQGLFEEVKGGIAGTDFQLNADNPLEFKRKLEEVRSELIDVRTETGKFNKDEQNLFDNISYILDELYADPDSKVPLIGGIINWASDFMPSEKDFEEVEEGLKLRAKDVYESYVKSVGKTFEEASGTVDYTSWLEGLYQKTKDVYGDEYFTYYKTAFDDMFKSIKLSFNDNIVPASDDFDAIEALVLKAKQGLSELDSAADKAAKSLDELDKVMKDNKDADKFFSAKDIVELLDKYPELADAIEKTEYGYKLNEKALEELKKKQLEEKKATLQAELDKSRIVLREAKRRLEAKKAEYEAITEAERNFIGPVRGDQLNKVKLYGDYNRSVKQLQDAEKTVSKIQMQIDVLDPDFKDIADSTADTKANLDDARKSLDKMKDDMDDAKKYVEDLLKLTMDMI
ncbi:MAG: phage tail tape measure protein, partial [Lachnospiraceae bacterium]|nr:phage tail tape measure protein [Lachnospiraceae bacterium]